MFELIPMLAAAKAIRRSGIRQNMELLESIGDVVGRTYRSHNGTGYIGTLTHIEAGYSAVTATLKTPSGTVLMFPFDTLVEVLDERS